MADLTTARAAKAHLRERLTGLDGICGIGLARGAEGYELHVAVTGAAARDAVPAVVDGVPVRVRVAGTVRARHDVPASRSIDRVHPPHAGR